jgi:hypothetical protein
MSPRQKIEVLEKSEEAHGTPFINWHHFGLNSYTSGTFPKIGANITAPQIQNSMPGGPEGPARDLLGQESPPHLSAL